MPVVFGDVEYQPNRIGKYYCPFDCHNPDFPKPSWKTDKGFLKHLENCRSRGDIPPPLPEYVEESRILFGLCPDCGSEIWKYTSVWTMKDKFVCIHCYIPYYEKGIGYHDSAGFELPGVTLTG